MDGSSTARMDLFDELENVASRLETVALSGCQAPEDPNGKDNSPAQILRIKEKMANQCFEMQIKISAEKLKKSCGEQESSRDMSECESEIEEARINHCNKTLALQRMQIWWGISEKLKKNDTKSEVLKASAKHSLELCSKILEVQQESSEIQDKVFQLQKKRLDLKRLIHEKMKEMEELKRVREHPEEGKYKKALEKGQEYLQKYQKMATMTQNVLQGTILASKVNWRDDPNLKDIALELEDIQLY